MYILPQILSISSKNFIIDSLLRTLKTKLNTLLDSFLASSIHNSYVKFTLCLQELFNDISSNLLKTFLECVDLEFKNSSKRKKKYFINKSNVKRTIVTIFGEITFYRTLYQEKITGEYYSYIDDIFGLEAYKTYDPVVRGILVQDSVWANPCHASSFSSLNILQLKRYLNNNLSIPKQTIYQFKREIKLKNINYQEIKHGKTLYVMADEKYIHKQDKNDQSKRKSIMSKVFVIFTGIERKGKRSRLLGKHIFITSSDKPWQELMNAIPYIYDFEALENINLLSDSGSWILAGASELRLYVHNKIMVNTCEFHVKQKINRSTTDKDLRKKLANIIYEKNDKEGFINEMDILIESKETETRKQTVTEYKNYIVKHWKGIQNMKESPCKSSMEAHIEHCVASVFSSVPKAYSDKHIEQYLKLQEMFLNGIPILKYYLETYNSCEDYVYGKEKELDFSIFEKSNSNVPIKYTSSSTATVIARICHSFR